MFDKTTLKTLFEKLNISSTDSMPEMHSMNSADFILDMHDIRCTETMLEQFRIYYEMLIDWNKRMNLTSITDPEGVMLKHFVDSAALLSLFEVKGKVIDVGTGAGFPGIPLKILRPEISLTLLDSLDKRIGFLKEVCSELRLKDVEAIHGRAEDFGKSPDYREQYDLCVSRAVSSLPVLSEYCIPFVKKGGFFVSYKSEACEEEIKGAQNAVKTLGAVIKSNYLLPLPDSDIRRRFVMIEKISDTPEKYPRKAGKPEKKPL